jgi:hypothetical protein
MKTYYSEKYPTFSVANSKKGWIQLNRLEGSIETEDPLILKEIEYWANANKAKFFAGHLR